MATAMSSLTDIISHDYHHHYRGLRHTLLPITSCATNLILLRKLPPYHCPHSLVTGTQRQPCRKRGSTGKEGPH